MVLSGPHAQHLSPTAPGQPAGLTCSGPSVAPREGREPGGPCVSWERYPLRSLCPLPSQMSASDLGLPQGLLGIIPAPPLPSSEILGGRLNSVSLVWETGMVNACAGGFPPERYSESIMTICGLTLFLAPCAMFICAGLYSLQGALVPPKPHGARPPY